MTRSFCLWLPLALALLSACSLNEDKVSATGDDSAWDSDSTPTADTAVRNLGAAGDRDADGVADPQDCAPDDPDIYPGAPESCLDEIDADCGGTTDADGADTASDCSEYTPDHDADGAGTLERDDAVCACAAPEGYALAGDCDDEDPAAAPGLNEQCDGVDNDCDGETDEADAEGCTDWYADRDGDGRGNADDKMCLCAQPDSDDEEYGAYTAAEGDDYNDRIPCTEYHRDGDHDDYGSADWTKCLDPGEPSYDYTTSDAADCDDDDATIYPGAQEICDEIDQDCDGELNEEDATGGTWYAADTDGDGWASEDDAKNLCEPDGIYTIDDQTLWFDCDDVSADDVAGQPAAVEINPSAIEVCDEVDNDCDGDVNEDTTNTYYLDADSDGFGDATSKGKACTLPDGYAEDATDCDDADADINPEAPEICDGVDNNCDGASDDGVTTTWYRDLDGDRYGDSETTTQACEAPPDYSPVDGDCDDNDDTVNPARIDTCDDVDSDCDGVVDDDPEQVWYVDGDGDGYGDPSLPSYACEQPAGHSDDDSDCDDDDPLSGPGQAETCDGADNDCDGEIDEDDGTGACTTYYADSDGDHYGDDTRSACLCEADKDYSAEVGGDCDDSDKKVHPGKDEVCDGVDNDCDDSIDVAATDCVQYYGDGDGDGYGVAALSSCLCAATGPLTATEVGDCDDTEATVYEGAAEICDDHLDNDCDGSTDLRDADCPSGP